MRTWFLLEHTEPLLSRLYQQIQLPDIALLFAGTELASYAEQSPVLIEDDQDSTLRQIIETSPAAWPGLRLQSEHSAETLLAHLRRILFIRFAQNRQGVLRYSNPTTASYFFPSCAVEELGFWLGPIDRLSWYGGTWAEQAAGQSRWHSLTNPAAYSVLAAIDPVVLSRDQHRVVQRQQQEHFVYQRWSHWGDVSYPDCLAWFDEALQLGFCEIAALEEFLSLRRAHPAAVLPDALPQACDAIRLEHLFAHLQTLSCGQAS